MIAPYRPVHCKQIVLVNKCLAKRDLRVCNECSTIDKYWLPIKSLFFLSVKCFSKCLLEKIMIMFCTQSMLATNQPSQSTTFIFQQGWTTLQTETLINVYFVTIWHSTNTYCFQRENISIEDIVNEELSRIIAATVPLISDFFFEDC